MIGVDVAEIARFEKHLHSRRFHEKILTAHEQALLRRRPKAETLASFFAVKEAASKALGTGIGRIGWRDIELHHTPAGQPWAVITDKQQKRQHKVAISLTHDAGIVIATARLQEERPFYAREVLQELQGMFRPRPGDLHKGTAGRACVFGGSEGMIGSICLAARAVLRAGAGYSYAAVRKDVYPIVQQKLLEPIVLPILTEDLTDAFTHGRKMHAIGIGPGLGTDRVAKQLIKGILREEGCPVVLDADALTLAAHHPDWLQQKKRPVILTPHGGEMKRLLETETSLTPAEFAKKYDIILVEKGPQTRIHEKRTYSNPTGNAGMATAGTGDVLTGVITGLLARGYSPLEAARVGVWVHGMAGDLARDALGEEGLIASDLLLHIPKALGMVKEDPYGIW